jgi:hypothetical protein
LDFGLPSDQQIWCFRSSFGPLEGFESDGRETFLNKFSSTLTPISLFISRKAGNTFYTHNYTYTLLWKTNSIGKYISQIFQHTIAGETVFYRKFICQDVKKFHSSTFKLIQKLWFIHLLKRLKQWTVNLIIKIITSAHFLFEATKKKITCCESA